MSAKLALVTGAGSGIGRASSLAFARGGADLVVSDIDEAGGEATAALVRQQGQSCIFVRADVGRAEDVENLLRMTAQHFGRLDYAHNNAGIVGKFAAMGDSDEADWDRVIAVDLTGVWRCMRQELPLMVRGGGGAIVNTSSVTGFQAAPHSGSYGAAKHGVLGLTRTAAVEYASMGVRVNAVLPGLTETPMIGSMPVPFRRSIESTIPMGRVARPEEIANVVVWLCSQGASYITGQGIIVDGGQSAI